MQFILTKTAMNVIKAIIASLFDRARLRLFGKVSRREDVLKGKTAIHDNVLSMPGIFDLAAHQEKVKPNEQLKAAVNRVAEGYLNVQEKITETQVIHAVQSFLTNAETGHKTNAATVLKENLSDIMQTVTNNVERIVETETTKAKNASSLDAISKISLAFNLSDPTVAFLVCRDDKTCDECYKVHCLEDKVTPRVYKMSEVSHSYHKKGDPTPSVSGLHPRCRCVCVSILPGYGFNKSGEITYISPDHDEYKKQRG